MMNTLDEQVIGKWCLRETRGLRLGEPLLSAIKVKVDTQDASFASRFEEEISLKAWTEDNETLSCWAGFAQVWFWK